MLFTFDKQISVSLRNPLSFLVGIFLFAHFRKQRFCAFIGKSEQIFAIPHGFELTVEKSDVLIVVNTHGKIVLVVNSEPFCVGKSNTVLFAAIVCNFDFVSARRTHTADYYHYALKSSVMSIPESVTFSSAGTTSSAAAPFFKRSLILVSISFASAGSALSISLTLSFPWHSLCSP